jgi:hypothetical protein
LPQPPQFCESVCVGTQIPSHMWPAQAQTPFTQLAPGAQAAPQAPQCAASVSTSTHSYPHAMMPRAEQTHSPREQDWLYPQRRPHAPQFLESLRTQEPPQSISSRGHTQDPSLHSMSERHWMSHPPQWSVRVETSTQ